MRRERAGEGSGGDDRGEVSGVGSRGYRWGCSRGEEGLEVPFLSHPQMKTLYGIQSLMQRKKKSYSSVAQCHILA